MPEDRLTAAADRAAATARALARAQGEPEHVVKRRGVIAKLRHIAANDQPGRRRSAASNELRRAEARLANDLRAAGQARLAAAIAADDRPATAGVSRRRGRPPGTGSRQLAERAAAASAIAAHADQEATLRRLADRLNGLEPQDVEPDREPKPAPVSFLDGLAVKLNARRAAVEGPPTPDIFGETAPDAEISPSDDQAPVPPAHEPRNADAHPEDSAESPATFGSLLAQRFGAAAAPMAPKPRKSTKPLGMRETLAAMEAEIRASGTNGVMAPDVGAKIAELQAAVATLTEENDRLKAELAKQRRGISALSLVDVLLKLDELLRETALRTAPAAMQSQGMSRSDAMNFIFGQFRSAIGQARARLRELPAVGRKIPPLPAVEPAAPPSTVGDPSAMLAAPEICPGVGSWRPRG